MSLANCNRIAKIFLSKIFSFEKFVIAVHIRICANAWMVLLKYFKLKTSGKQPLPNPNGELSAKIPSSGISSANACVGKLLDGNGPRDERDSGLRCPYKILTSAQKFDIGKRAAEIGTTAAMCYNAKNYPHLDLKEISVRRFKNHYQTQLKTSTKEISGSSTVQELVPKKRSCPL